MNRKYLALGLCLVLSLSACGGQKATQEPQQEPDQKVVQQMETTPDLVQVKAETPIEPEAPTGENAVEEAAPVDEAGPVDEVETVETVDLFTSCEETVYATGEVNIRASWTPSSDKLGSLARGDSVIRTGNSITGTEAENWSRVQLSDGSTAYINNNYLSTTKPAPAQQATGGKGATGGTGATGGSGGSGKATKQATTDSSDLGVAGWKQDANGNWHLGTAPDTPTPATPQPTNPGSPIRDFTDEEHKKAGEASARVNRGEQELIWNEEGGFYYYEVN